MSDLDHAHLLILAARRDLKALAGMLDGDTFSDEIFGFHAQQVVEKALKSWFSLYGVEYPRIHDLEELFALLEDNGQNVPDSYRTLKDLTDFAVQYRYEAYDELSSELDRGDVIGKATSLVEHVGRLLSGRMTSS